MPMRIWWRGRLATLLRELMRDSRCADMGWINPASVERCITEHCSREAEHDTRLWLILWLELWARIVLDGSMGRDESLAAMATDS
jgi:hypothetical protein